MGYSAGQLHRMTAYTPEIQAEIDNLERCLADAGWPLKAVMEKLPVGMPKGLTPEEANDMADRLRTLRARYHAAYMGEKRRNLVVKHGYDTKNAAHTIRLLRMCVEFLKTGWMNVYRTDDAEELKSIKRGEWTVEQVKAEAERLFAEAKTIQSDLPEEPNYDAVADFVSKIVFSYYSGRKVEYGY